MNDKLIAKTRWETDALAKKLARTMKEGAVGIENAYVASYNQLVALGAAPKLRGKYRPR